MNSTALFTAFILKHYLCDFPLQFAYQYRNKGMYGHPGGVLHALIHAAGTLAIFLIFSVNLSQACIYALADGVIHYHIDWLKMRLVKRWRLGFSHEHYWTLLGADQMLHYLTYVALSLVASIS